MIKLTKRGNPKKYSELALKAIKAAVSCMDSELQDVDPEACTAKLDGAVISFTVETDDGQNLTSITVNYPDEPTTYEVTPMREAQINLALDETPAVHVVDPAKRHQDFIDRLYSDDDDDEDYDDDFSDLDLNIPISHKPYTVDEFIDDMSPCLYRCESAVKNYLKENPNCEKVMISALKYVPYIYLDKDDNLMAHMLNGTEKKFTDLTIGQFISITDEILYRTTLK